MFMQSRSTYLVRRVFFSFTCLVSIKTRCEDSLSGRFVDRKQTHGTRLHWQHLLLVSQLVYVLFVIVNRTCFIFYYCDNACYANTMFFIIEKLMLFYTYLLKYDIFLINFPGITSKLRLRYLNFTVKVKLRYLLLFLMYVYMWEEKQKATIHFRGMCFNMKHCFSISTNFSNITFLWKIHPYWKNVAFLVIN